MRDYHDVETDTRWFGSIGNWQYEAQRPVPPTWGKGAESIFRKLLREDRTVSAQFARRFLIRRPGVRTVVIQLVVRLRAAC